MRWVAGLFVALVLAGCTSRVGGAPDKKSGAGDEVSAEVGAVDLRVPLELCQVLTSTPTLPPSTAPPTAPSTAPSTDPTRIVEDAEGNEYRVEDPFLTVERIEHGSVALSNGNWTINLTLTDQDGNVFTDWTTSHVGEQVAVVADDEVIFAPEIAQPIAGNEIQINGNYTREEAEKVFDDITGR